MRKFSFLFILILISGCDASLKKYPALDDEMTENNDIEFEDDELQDDFETFEVVSLRRKKISAPFDQMENFRIEQNAILNLPTGLIKRNFNHVDTSFEMHGDDIIQIRKIIDKLIENTGCLECEENETFFEIKFENDETCQLCNDQLLEDIDYYLLIPVRSMLWPFDPQNEPHPVGHHSVSFQNYAEEEGNYEGAYFHHGIDIVMPEVKEVYNQIEGRVTKIDHYRTDLVGEHPLYFEVVVETVNGLTFEYHHIDKNTVPEKIYEALESGEIIPEKENLGKIVFWSMPDAFSKNFFHHVHLNIMNREKIKINPALLMLPQKDKTEPVIEEIFLIDDNRTKTLSDKLDEPFHIVVKVHDFTDEDPWPNPPRFSEIYIYDETGSPVFYHAGYDFIAMLDSDETVFVCDYYLCLMDEQNYSYGDYLKREFFVVITAFDIEGNTADPIDPALFEPEEHTIFVRSCDENGNCTEESIVVYFI